MFPFWIELSADWLAQLIVWIVVGWSVLSLTHRAVPHP